MNLGPRGPTYQVTWLLEINIWDFNLTSKTSKSHPFFLSGLSLCRLLGVDDCDDDCDDVTSIDVVESSENCESILPTNEVLTRLKFKQWTIAKEDREQQRFQQKKSQIFNISLFGSPEPKFWDWIEWVTSLKNDGIRLHPLTRTWAHTHTRTQTRTNTHTHTDTHTHTHTRTLTRKHAHAQERAHIKRISERARFHFFRTNQESDSIHCFCPQTYLSII